MTVQLISVEFAARKLCEPCGKNRADFVIAGGWVLEMPYVIEYVCKPCAVEIWSTGFTIVPAGHFNPNKVLQRLAAMAP